MKKLLDTKGKEFKVKSINKELMTLTKYLWYVLTIKDMCQRMEFICWFILIKIVSQAVKRLKKILVKKIVIIEKGHDN